MNISFTIDFCDGIVLRTIDLACVRFDVAHSGVNIAEKLKDILVETGLDPMKCTGVTMDNPADMSNAGEVLDAVEDILVERGPCFCHFLSCNASRGWRS